jgi:hypothetical protein
MAPYRSMRRTAYQQTGRHSGLPALLLRLGGVGAVLAGVLFVAWGYLHQKDAPLYYDVVVDKLAVIVPTLFVLGLPALWRRGAGRAFRFTQTGVVVGLTGAALATIRNLEDVAGHLWHTYAPTTGYPTLLLHVWVPVVWVPMLLAGLLLSGVGLVGERGTRGLGALLLAMATCGWVYYFTDFGSTFEVRSVHVGFGLLFSLGWVVLGLMLWAEAARHARGPDRPSA